MPSRSRMAAWALVAGLSGFAAARGDGDARPTNKVRLDIQIAGLGDAGGRVEIRPGHPGCSFRPVARVVPASGKLDTIAILATSTGADRDCSFAITVREPGQPPRTYRRGLRLALRPPGGPVPEQSLKCYLSAPSLAAQDEAGRTRR